MLILVFEQSLLFFPFALALFLTYIILKTTDLTVDGSFVLGAGVFAKLVTSQTPSLLALMIAVAMGALAGFGVSLIQRSGRIHSLIASILAVFILSSLNLQMMGRPNIHLLSTPSFLPELGSNSYVALLTLFNLILGSLALLLLNSTLGLKMRAYGENPLLLRLMGQRAELYKVIGLVLSNALAAYCGTLTALSHGYADIHMGFGMALIGIGTVAIGEQLRRNALSGLKSFSESSLTSLHPNNGTKKQQVQQRSLAFCRILVEQLAQPLGQLLFCFIGVFLYFLALNTLLRCGIDPLNLKMAIGLLLIFALSATSQKEVRHA